jgi:hypothetical protein
VLANPSLVITYPGLADKSAAEIWGARAVIRTSVGDMRVRFHPHEAPDAVRHFIRNAAVGKYDNVLFADLGPPADSDPAFPRVAAGRFLSAIREETDREEIVNRLPEPPAHVKANLSRLEHRRGMIGFLRMRDPYRLGMKLAGGKGGEPVVVDMVAPGGPAARAGITPGDAIVSIMAPGTSATVATPDDLYDATRALATDTQVTVLVRRKARGLGGGEGEPTGLGLRVAPERVQYFMSGGTDFYIATGPSPSMDGELTLFAEVDLTDPDSAVTLSVIEGWGRGRLVLPLPYFVRQYVGAAELLEGPVVYPYFPYVTRDTPDFESLRIKSIELEAYHGASVPEGASVLNALR